MKKYFLGICWFLIGLQIVQAQHEKVSISSSPGWITKVDIQPSENRNARGTGGTFYLLVDYQDHVDRQEEYVHYAFRIKNNEGLQNSSDIQVDFDPAYQSLTFHEITIHRDGRKIGKLDSDRINTFKKEDKADRHLYDGSIRAVVNLTDVRVGDVIEYAYTIRGFNPLYEGRYFTEYYLEAGFPFEKMHVRIVASENRKLNFSYQNGAKRPAVTDTGNHVEYRWITSDPNPKLYDDGTPGWYNPYPYVSVSSFDSWGKVVDWALPHYSFTSAELASLRKNFDEHLTGDEKNNILQAIRFVQDEIRYLGFEGGMSAYKPHDPLSVLKRRFGDCKDKSVLLAALLQAEGFSAHPMLVNSSETKAIAEGLPSPEAFDHCVVKITYEGEDFFVDPTISNQGGTLDNLYFPGYGKGLVIEKGVTDLIDLPVPNASKVIVKETFDIEEVGEGASFEVVTEYYGDRADYQRSFFSSYSLDEITREYISYYATVFPSISPVKNVEFIDEDRNGSNKVVVKESYEIAELWQPSPGNSDQIVAEFYPLVLQSYLSTSVSTDRKAPYYIGEPTSYIQETILELPEFWPVNEQKQEISAAGFQYSSEVIAESDQLVKLTYAYQTNKESIPAGEMEEFVSSQKEIENTMTFSLFYNTAIAGFQFSWLAFVLFVVSIVVSIFIARHFYLNYDPQPVHQGGARELGGWLLLFIIGIALSPVIIAVDLVNTPEMFNQGIWSLLLSPGDASYNPELAILIVFEIFYNGFIIVFSVFLLYLLIKKRSSVPRLAIAYMVINLVMLFADTFMATTLVEEAFTQTQIQGYYGEVFRSFLSTCIWVPYFLISDRVKETFVNRIEKEPQPVLAGEGVGEQSILT